jgi:Coenzyme PQQ synthesis protein D (PqqD)
VPFRCQLESKICYSLNLTGERIWQGLKDGLTPKEISGQLQKEFDVEAERAIRSVDELIDETLSVKAGAGFGLMSHREANRLSGES